MISEWINMYEQNEVISIELSKIDQKNILLIYAL